jgi:hypothetical protein
MLQSRRVEADSQHQSRLIQSSSPMLDTALTAFEWASSLSSGDRTL